MDIDVYLKPPNQRFKKRLFKNSTAKSAYRIQIPIYSHRFPLELHLVHYAKVYQSFQNALRYPSGVAVFAVLFDVSCK